MSQIIIIESVEALDKATKGPWTTKETKYGYADILGNELFYSGITGKDTNVTVARVYSRRANGEVITAVPDALAWIKEALPWLEAYAETMRDSREEWDRNNAARLDALIARAKSEEVGK